MFRTSLLTIFALYAACVLSMPTDKQADKSPQLKETATAELETELDKLKQDGVALSKSQQTISKTVNGKVETQNVQQETISDAKTGKVVATVEKTITKNENGEQKDAQIVVPAAGINEELHGADVDKLELAPAEDVAKYIFDTSDVDGVENTIEALVDGKKLTKKAAQSYMDQIRDHLNVMHDAALQEMVSELEQQRQDEDKALQDMIEMAQILSRNEKVEETLYNYVKKMYTLYKKDGDEYAKNILTKYTSSIQQAGQAGEMNEAVQEGIYGIILQALNDANEELGLNKNDAVESVKTGKDSSTKSLRR